MTKSIPVKKKHHSVPITTLKNFVDSDGFLHFWRREKGPGNIDKAVPSAIFYEKYLYSFEPSVGRRDNRLEDFYSDSVEAPAGALFQEVFPDIRAGRAPRLSLAQRDTLINFWYFQVKRTRAYVEALMEDIGTEKIIDEGLENPALSDGFTLEARPALRSRMLRNIRVAAQGRAPTDEILTSLREIGLCFFRPYRANKSYIVGDVPGASVAVPGMPDGRIPVLPLASDVAMGFIGKTTKISLYNFGDDAVRSVNEAIASRSNLIAGKSPALIRSLSKASIFRGVRLSPDENETKT